MKVSRFGGEQLALFYLPEAAPSRRTLKLDSALIAAAIASAWFLAFATAFVRPDVAVVGVLGAPIPIVAVLGVVLATRAIDDSRVAVAVVLSRSQRSKQSTSLPEFSSVNQPSASRRRRR